MRSCHGCVFIPGYIIKVERATFDGNQQSNINNGFDKALEDDEFEEANNDIERGRCVVLRVSILCTSSI